jgi:hypothetical protein
MRNFGGQQAPLSRTPPIPYRCADPYELFASPAIIAPFDDEDIQVDIGREAKALIFTFVRLLKYVVDIEPSRVAD